MNDHTKMSFGEFFDRMKQAEDFKTSCTEANLDGVKELLPLMEHDQVFWVLKDLPQCDASVRAAIFEHHQGNASFFHALLKNGLQKSVPHVVAWIVPLMPRSTEVNTQLLIAAENAIHIHDMEMVDLLEDLVQVIDKYQDFMRTAAYSGHVDLVLRWLDKVNCHHPYATFLSSAAENNKVDVVRVLAPLCTNAQINIALDHSWNYDLTEITEILFDVIKDDAIECDRAFHAAQKFHKRYNATPTADRFIELCEAHLLRATLTEQVKPSLAPPASARKI